MLKRETITDYARIGFGSFLFALSVNLFVVPAGMYNGGIYGIAQILRTLIIGYAGIPLPQGLDISGIINFVLNIPLFYIAFRFVSRQFFRRTVMGLLIQTILLSVIPIPTAPMFEDPLLDALIGGLLTGYGLGLILRAKGCSGGVDIIGIYCLKKDIKITVGRISLIINAMVYLVCAYLYDLNIACFSVIYAAIVSYAMDKTHYQNINMLCFIVTRNKELQHSLTNVLGRGVTYWDGKGAFTEEDVLVNAVVISKYEVKDLKRIVNEIDPGAFVFMSEGITVDGYYLKKL
ncbi:MAG: YitT family protein [Lachnospiraceae bacterium]